MNKNRIVWRKPGKYAKSFIIAAILLLIGVTITFFTETKVPAIIWPVNFFIGLSIIIVILALFFWGKKSPFVKWMSSIPTAISAICSFTILVLLMAFIPQKGTETEATLYYNMFSDILHSYAYLIALIYLLLSLAMVTLKRCTPFKLSNIAFFLNHFGLWIILFAGSLGAGDTQIVNVTVNKTNAVFSGIDKTGDTISDLGLAILLKEFNIEEYAPKLFVINDETGDVLDNKVFSLKKGKKDDILEWDIEVVEYFNYGIKMNDIFYPIFDEGASPAAYVTITNKITKQKKSEWISCGSYRYPGKVIMLKENKVLVMSPPEPKKYSSHIKVFTPKNGIYETTVEVNKPSKINGWMIYQLDYNHDKGRWSDVSILELVHDPWLPIVYLGIFMLIIGSIFMFWVGNK